MTYKIFLSHSLHYKDHEPLVREILDKIVLWKDESIFRFDPIHAREDECLESAIDNKIMFVTCLIVLNGSYHEYKRWITKEINSARKHGKPIVFLQPMGREHSRSQSPFMERCDSSATLDEESLLLALSSISGNSTNK